MSGRDLDLRSEPVSENALQGRALEVVVRSPLGSEVPGAAWLAKLGTRGRGAGGIPVGTGSPWMVFEARRPEAVPRDEERGPGLSSRKRKGQHGPLQRWPT